MRYSYTLYIIFLLSFHATTVAHSRNSIAEVQVFTDQNSAIIEKFLLPQGPPTTSTNAVPRFENGISRLLKNSTVLIDDQGNVTLNGITKDGNTIAWPDSVGPNGTYLASNGTSLVFVNPPGGTGNVITDNLFLSDNRLIRTDTSSGATNIQESSVTLDDTGNLSGINNLTASGTIDMLAQAPVHFQDASGGQYVGIQAPAVVSPSYTLTLPSIAPTASQILQANASTPTNLQWATLSGSLAPAISKSIYVANYGNDTTGNGSSNNPYATLAKALNVANSISSVLNPIIIFMQSGTYIEDNSAGPLQITAAGISITGLIGNNKPFNAPIIIPNNPTLPLLSIVGEAQISNILFTSPGISTAPCIVCNVTNPTIFQDLVINNFYIGVTCQGNTAASYLFSSCFFQGNQTAITIDDVIVVCDSCIVNGTGLSVGISIEGANAQVFSSACIYAFCNPAVNITNNARVALSSGIFRSNSNALLTQTSANLTLQSTSFELDNTLPAVTDIIVKDAGTIAKISGCIFNGQTLSPNTSTALQVIDQAQVLIDSCQIDFYTNGFIVGSPTDTAATQLNASGIIINNTTNDIVQNGLSKLNFASGTVASNKITINDSTNVTMAYFDLNDNNALTIGSTSNQDFSLVEASVTTSNEPRLAYKTSLYTTPGIGMDNSRSNDPITNFALAQDAAYIAAITQNRTKPSGVYLVSDTGSPVGTFSALRGWTITKNATTAELNFQYQNSDPFVLSLVPPYTVMQLDGENNQVQLPALGTQLVFAGDTNLYRSSANTLTTDDNFAINTLTANRAITTDANKQLTSSATTNTELGYVSGVTSSIQTQLDNKVSKNGDVMTGVLQLPAGTSAVPSLTFTGSTTTGLSANSGSLSFNTNGQERMHISSAGTITIDAFNTAGVVHNNLSGDLSTALISNADIAPAAAIADTKLATISSPGKVSNSATTGTSSNTANALVMRDASGNFSAGTITANLMGNVTGSASNNVLKAGDIMTGQLYLPAGTAANPSLQFTGSTNTGIAAGNANTLSLSTNGAERLVISPTGTVTINGLASTGLVHTDNSGVLSTSLLVDGDITSATIANDKLATISSNNTSNAIVVRDALGNFSTNMITIDGTVSNATDVVTKAYVDAAVSGGLEAKTPAEAVATSNIVLSGTQTIDGVALNANDRVLLVAQTNPVENGLWLVQAGSWTRPTDFASGNQAGQAYVLIIAGTTNAGTSWLCNTPSAVIDTDPVTFAQFSLADPTTGANVGTGIGQVFKNKNGVTLNFKTLAAGTHMVLSNNANDVTFATDATAANTANTLVTRDGSGNFSANTISANVTGVASGNVAKTGDSISGALLLLTQNQLQLQDLINGNVIGLQAPTTVPSSYTVSLPSSAPLAGQILQANNTTPTQLEWFSLGTSAVPTQSKAIYVTKYGNDTTGDGSQNAPFLTLAKAISIANSLSSTANPVIILIASGIYIENNSAGPLSITAGGISIVGGSRNVTIVPTTLSNDLLSIITTTQLQNLTFNAAGVSTASGIVLSGAGNLSLLENLTIANFATGLLCTGMNAVYKVSTCFFITNGIGMSVQNNVNIACANCLFQGGTTTPANTGMVFTGANCIGSLLAGVNILCSTLVHVTNQAAVAARSGIYARNANDFVVDTGGNLLLQSCVFEPRNIAIPAIINVSATDVGTTAKLIGCIFDGGFLTPGTDITAVQVSDQASCIVSSGEINNYKNGFIVGLSTDTIATNMQIASFFINNCTNDIIQQGSSTLNLNASTASSSKISINDPTNVHLAYFDLINNNALTIGSLTDQDFNLIHAGITTSNTPDIAYKSSLYGAQAIGFDNTANGNPAANYSLGQNSSYLLGVTQDRAQISGMRLVSDTGSPVGTTTALRGWNMYKKASSAELAFDYSNSDTTGQAAIADYTLMQLDGVNNQVQLPNTGSKLVFAGDTNLYRSAANVLKTDDNLIINGLTANRAVATNASQQLVSSTTTDTELDYLAGTTSAIQPQIDSKVAKNGDVMTGALQLPAGTSAAPALIFTGSTTTGLSANTNTLSLNTSGVERMKINASGTVAINGFTTVGVVHNDVTGNLSTSLITNADISATANINDTKLATISTAGKVANSATTATSSLGANTIVLRDASNNFSAGTITATLNGNASTATSTTTATNATNFTGSLSGDVTGTQSATVVSTVGGQSATNVASGSAAANTATNLNVGNTIVKRDSSGNFTANLITATLNGNATSTINFSGSLSGDVTGTQSATVVSIVGGQTAANVASATLAANAATNLNGANTIVKRDASGNFTASNITATLNGNAATATTATTATNATNFTGSLSGDVTGTQSATVVSTVGGQTAANVASATTAANAATNLNTASTIVKRDASGNFSAGTITAALSGNATTATTATNFSGSLSGNVTGTQSATVVSSVGGQSATNVASGSAAANAATNLNGGNTIVKRDASGNFTAGTITATLNGNATTATTATNFSGSLSGDVTGTQSATVVSIVGGQTAANVASATTAANAATNANTASTIVKRDASGNFSAGTITAALIGAASLNVLKTGDTMTGTLQLPAGTDTVPSLQFTGSTNTGLSAALNTLTLSANGTTVISANTSAVKITPTLVASAVLCLPSITSVQPNTNGSVTVSNSTAILLLKPLGNITNYTVTFPGSPTNGQLFTIILGTAFSVDLVNSTTPNSLFGGVTTLNTSQPTSGTAGGSSVTYIYAASGSTWYRYSRG